MQKGISAQRTAKSKGSYKHQEKRILQPEPELQENPIYRNPNIPEYNRISFSRIRLGSHHLKIETGRWSRISRKNRLCQCNEGIQSEEHVLLKCKLTEHPRTNSEEIKNCANIKELFQCENQSELAKLCYQVLKTHEQL